MPYTYVLFNCTLSNIYYDLMITLHFRCSLRTSDKIHYLPEKNSTKINLLKRLKSLIKSENSSSKLIREIVLKSKSTVFRHVYPCVYID